MKLHWTAAASTLVSSSTASSVDDTRPIWRRVRRQGSPAGHNNRKVLLSEEVTNAFLLDQPSDEPNADINFPTQHLAPDENEDSTGSSKREHYGVLKNDGGTWAGPGLSKGAPCDPNSSSSSDDDPDVGILLAEACDTGLVCEENPHQGGSFQCVDENQASETTRHSRILSDYYYDDYYDVDCDYSDFDRGTNTGTVYCAPDEMVCIGDEYVYYDFGLPEGTCFRYTATVVYDPEKYPANNYGVAETLMCVNFYQGQYDAKGDSADLCVDHSDYYTSGDSTGDCRMFVNGKACRSCTFDFRDTCSFDVDCSNTCWGSTSTVDLCSYDTDLSPVLDCFGSQSGINMFFGNLDAAHSPFVFGTSGWFWSPAGIVAAMMLPAWW